MIVDRETLTPKTFSVFTGRDWWLEIPLILCYSFASRAGQVQSVVYLVVFTPKADILSVFSRLM